MLPHASLTFSLAIVTLTMPPYGEFFFFSQQKYSEGSEVCYVFLFPPSNTHAISPLTQNAHHTRDGLTT